MVVVVVVASVAARQANVMLCHASSCYYCSG